MKSRITDTKTNGQAAAHSAGEVSAKSAPSYQIDDRRGASIMQRKFRNLANGLASANIMDNRAQSLQKKAAALQAKSPASHSAFGQETSE